MWWQGARRGELEGSWAKKSSPGLTFGEGSAVRVAEGKRWVAGFCGEDDREGAFWVRGRVPLGARGPQCSAPTVSVRTATLPGP